MRLLRIPILIILSILLWACSRPDGPPPPTKNTLTKTNLVSPANNTQCFGTKGNSEKILVQFDWEDVPGISSYLLEYKELTTGVSNSITRSESFAQLELEPGTLYSWTVTISDANGNSVISDEFNFYSEGLSEPNHAPFPADIDFFDNGDGTGTLIYDTFDLDNDIDHYQIFFDV